MPLAGPKPVKRSPRKGEIAWTAMREVAKRQHARRVAEHHAVILYDEDAPHKM